MDRRDRRFQHVAAGGGAAYSLIGEVITIKVSSEATGDVFSVTELSSHPGGGPPLHTHPAAEVFIVQEGAFEFSGLERGEPYTIHATPGDIVFIPGGAAHTYKGVGPTRSKAIGVLAPGGEMERFFAEVGTRVSDGSPATTPAGPPSEEEIARHIAIAQRHGIVFLAAEEAPASGVAVAPGQG
jgi:quercetin dioxygenase-like cupin family protein